MHNKILTNVFDAQEFILNHPLLPEGSARSDIFPGVNFWISQVDEHGYTRGESICIEKDHPRAEEFKELFEGEDYAYISYEDYYNHPWMCDHTTYNFETSFPVFIGDNPTELIESYKPENWEHWGGPDVEIFVVAKSFDEGLIELANAIGEKFGFVSREDFYTEEEKANHERCSPLDFNAGGWSEKYICVTDATINLRWLEAYILKQKIEGKDVEESWNKAVEKMHNGKK